MAPKKQQQQQQQSTATTTKNKDSGIQQQLQQQADDLGGFNNPPRPESTSRVTKVCYAISTILQGVVLALLIILTVVTLSASCFTHRHPVSLYLGEKARAAALDERSAANPLAWQYLGDAPADFALLQQQQQQSKKTSSSDNQHPSVGSSFCRLVADNMVISNLISSVPLPREETSNSSSSSSSAVLPADLYEHVEKNGLLGSFVRGIFKTARRIDFYLSTTLALKSPFFNEQTTSLLAKSATAVSSENNKGKKTTKSSDDDVFHLCAFARAGLANSFPAAGARIANLFDFVVSSELREILVARSGTLFGNSSASSSPLPLDFSEFVRRENSIGGQHKITDDATAMFRHLQHLYFFTASSSAAADTSFLGDFLRGFIRIPNNNNNKGEATTTILRFAVSQSRMNDGIVDCCDGSDEPDSVEHDDDDDKSNKKKKSERAKCLPSLRSALHRVQEKLYRLARADSICRARARSGQPRLKALVADVAEQAASFEPQWQGFVAEYQKRAEAVNRAHGLATQAQTQKNVKRFNRLYLAFQQFQQQGQQLQQIKSRLEQVRSALATDSYGDSGQLLSVYEKKIVEEVEVEAEMEQQDGDEKKKKATTTTKTRTVPFCINMTLSPKQIAGGSAEPVFENSIVRICPFRGVESSSAEKWAEYHKEQQQQPQEEDEEGKQKPLEEPDWTHLGAFHTNLGWWPVAAFAGRSSFIDLVPQLPSRFAAARILAAKRHFYSLLQSAKQQQQQHRSNSNNDAFSPDALLSEKDRKLLERATAMDATATLQQLVNSSLESVQGKYEQKKGEFVEAKRTEFVEAQQERVKKMKADAGMTVDEQQQQQQADPAPEALAAIAAVEKEEFDADAALVNYSAFSVSDFIEHRFNNGDISSFLLRDASMVSANVGFYRFGQSCWQGPVERTVAVFLVCGDRERIIDFREDGKCLYEAVVETPSVCCTAHETQEQVGETTGVVSASGATVETQRVELSLFHTKMQQQDNTLMRRYSGIEYLLEAWEKTL